MPKPMRYKVKPTTTTNEAIKERDRVWGEAKKDVKAGKVVCLSDLIGASENVILCSIKGDKNE